MRQNHQLHRHEYQWIDKLLKEVHNKLPFVEANTLFIHSIMVHECMHLRGGSMVLKEAALFHDIIEDCAPKHPNPGQYLEELRISQEAIPIIIAVTRRDDEEYFQYIQRINIGSDEACEVKLCDLDVNIQRCLAREERSSLLDRYTKALDILRKEKNNGTT